MTEAAFYDVMRQGLWVAFTISIPILGVALAAGLLVGLFQALTSIQEMTLTFVPKLAAMIGVFWLSMAFMSETLVALWQDTLVPMIIGG
ncbi:MAG: flagellar biosynthetic protein FliQ [Pseudomonadota bacterium]